jgi:uncharacterized protein (TIGR03086 family)
VTTVSEVSERYGRVAAGFASRLGRLTSHQLAAPTPCSEWTARQLVAHVIGTHGRVVATLDQSAPDDVDADGDLQAQWQATSGAVAAALEDPALSSRTVGGMFGEQSFEALVGRLLCADTVFHTWDLARATGQDERLDPEAVSQALEFLTPLDDAIRRPGGFAPKISSSADADEQTRLLNFGGRAVDPAPRRS